MTFHPTPESLRAAMLSAFNAAIEADNDFHALLVAKFGRNAGDMRYKSASWRSAEIDAAFERKCASDHALRNATAEMRQYGVSLNDAVEVSR